MPRETMRSMDARRAADMPTDFGVLTGSPSDAARATYAPRRRWTTVISHRTAWRSRAIASTDLPNRLPEEAAGNERQKTVTTAGPGSKGSLRCRSHDSDTARVAG